MSTQANQKQSVQKIITFSPTLYQYGLKMANRKGVSFQDYMRHLLLKDIDEKDEPLYMVDEETEKGIGQSLKDYEEGHYVTAHTREDLDRILDGLTEE